MFSNRDSQLHEDVAVTKSTPASHITIHVGFAVPALDKL